MLTDQAGRPVADPGDSLYAPHVAGLRLGVLVAQRCEHCGRVQWPPRDLCLACHAETLGPAQVSVDGVIHTFTICHRAFHPWFVERVPFAIVVGEVGDGLRFLGGYAGDVTELACGQPVTAGVEWVDEAAYLTWVPAAGRHR